MTWLGFYPRDHRPTWSDLVSFSLNLSLVRCKRHWCSTLYYCCYCFSKLFLVSSHSLPRLPRRNGLTLCKPLSDFPQESPWTQAGKIFFFPHPSSNPLPLESLPVSPLILGEGVRRRESKWMRARNLSRCAEHGRSPYPKLSEISHNQQS